MIFGPDEPIFFREIFIITLQFLSSAIFLARSGISDTRIRQAILFGFCASSLAIACIVVYDPFDSLRETSAYYAVLISPVLLVVTAAFSAVVVAFFRILLNRRTRTVE